MSGRGVLGAVTGPPAMSAPRSNNGIRLFDDLFGIMHRHAYRDFIAKIGTSPNLCLPETIWDKYLWRKIFDRDPQFTAFCDKLAAKGHAAVRCPDLSVPTVFWQGDDIREAPRELLEGPGFLKSNYGSGFYLKLHDKPRCLDELHAITSGWQRGWHHTKPRKWKYRDQWGYRNIKRTLFIEEDLGRPGKGPIVDFAVYTYGTKVTHMSVMLDHKTEKIQKYARFDGSGRRSATERTSAKFKPLPRGYRPPVPVAAICDVAMRLAGDRDHLRADLTWNGERLYFSELTVYSQAGFVSHLDQTLLAEMNRAWDLRRSWFLTHPQKGWRRLYADWLRKVLDERDDGQSHTGKHERRDPLQISKGFSETQ